MPPPPVSGLDLIPRRKGRGHPAPPATRPLVWSGQRSDAMDDVGYVVRDIDGAALRIHDRNPSAYDAGDVHSVLTVEHDPVGAMERRALELTWHTRGIETFPQAKSTMVAAAIIPLPDTCPVRGTRADQCL